MKITLQLLSMKYFICKGCVRCIFASLFSSLEESTCEIWKNVCYFTLKAHFVLEKFKFLYFRYSNFMTSLNASA